jgi:hypothetical protein
VFRRLQVISGYVSIGASYNALNRYRMALIGLFAVATALQMWAANVTLNLAGGASFCMLSYPFSY